MTEQAQVLHTVASAQAHFGQIDILVNNAWGRRPGGRGYAPIEALQAADVDWAMDMAPKAALWAMQAVYPGMGARGWGRIINMCSLNGVNAHPYTGDYNMGKEALRTLTRSAAREWAPYGICCNAMCPGAATEAYAQFAAANPDFVALPAGEVLTGLKVENAPSLCAGGEDGQLYLRLWPHRHATDGFFAAVWEKK